MNVLERVREYVADTFVQVNSVSRRRLTQQEVSVLTYLKNKELPIFKRRIL